MSIAWPLYGHDTAEASFLASATTGKLHHGWLIEGPSGIGKATMANRLAAYMLGARKQRRLMQILLTRLREPVLPALIPICAWYIAS